MIPVCGIVNVADTFCHSRNVNKQPVLIYKYKTIACSN